MLDTSWYEMSIQTQKKKMIIEENQSFPINEPVYQSRNKRYNMIK